MAFTCAFSSGFSNGFEICEEETPATPTVTLRGIPAPIPRDRKRPDVIDISGEGFISVIGRGSMAGEACLSATFDIETDGSAVATNDAIRILIAAIQTGAECLIASERSVGGLAYVIPATTAVVSLEAMAGGSGVILADADGVMARDVATGARMRITAGGEAVIVAEESEDWLAAAAMWLARRLTA